MLAGLIPLAALAAAAPALVERANGPTDVQILNYALTLEHLENAFYHAGLSNFSKADFDREGAAPNFYANLKEISHDEETHVSFLSGALGSAAVKPCNYAFPVTDAKSFLAVANILEGVGVSAYLGAAQYIAKKAYLTAAGSILTVEARHSAIIRTQNKMGPFPYPFDTPLDFNEVFSLASLFITGCPNGLNLPFKAFPALSATPGAGAPGTKLSLVAAKSVKATNAFFITGAGPVAAALSGSGTKYTVTIPQGATPGQDYLVLTNSKADPTDSTIVAGPAVIAVADYATKSTKPHGYGN